MNKLKKLLELLKAMKRMETGGFPDEAGAKEYFLEKEQILDEMGMTLEEITTGQEQEIEALKGTIKTLKDSLKGQSQAPRILSMEEFKSGLLIEHDGAKFGHPVI